MSRVKGSSSSNTAAAAFLQKALKSKHTVGVQESLEDDDAGFRTVVVERRFLGEPLDALGIRLSDDAQVISVAADGLCRRVPPHYFIVHVNEQFVDSREAFYAIAEKELRLVLKIYNGSAMEELLARILLDGEHLDVKALFETTPRYAFLGASHPLFMRWTDRSRKSLDAKRLLQVVQDEADEKAAQESLLALQATAMKAEEEERARELALRQQQLEEQRAEEAARQEALAASRLDQLVIQESLFRTDLAQAPDYFNEAASPGAPAVVKPIPDDAQGESETPSTGTAGEKGDEAQPSCTALKGDSAALGEGSAVEAPPDLAAEAADADDQPTAEELMRIVSGAGGDDANLLTPLQLHSEQQNSLQLPGVDELRSILFGVDVPPLPGVGAAVPPSQVVAVPEDPDAYKRAKVMVRISQKYTLSSGREVDVAIKERHGAKPPPPDGEPRRRRGGHQNDFSSAADGRRPAPGTASTALLSRCSFCQSVEHVAKDCAVKRAENSKRWLELEAERLKSLRDKEICRDFQHNRCTRNPCPFLHKKDDGGPASAAARDRRARSDSESRRGARKRSRSPSSHRHHRGASRGNRRSHSRESREHRRRRHSSGRGDAGREDLRDRRPPSFHASDSKRDSDRHRRHDDKRRRSDSVESARRRHEPRSRDETRRGNRHGSRDTRRGSRERRREDSRHRHDRDDKKERRRDDDHRGSRRDAAEWSRDNRRL